MANRGARRRVPARCVHETLCVPTHLVRGGADAQRDSFRGDALALQHSYLREGSAAQSRCRGRLKPVVEIHRAMQPGQTVQSPRRAAAPRRIQSPRRAGRVLPAQRHQLHHQQRLQPAPAVHRRPHHGYQVRVPQPHERPHLPQECRAAAGGTSGRRQRRREPSRRREQGGAAAGAAAAAADAAGTAVGVARVRRRKPLEGRVEGHARRSTGAAPLAWVRGVDATVERYAGVDSVGLRPRASSAREVHGPAAAMRARGNQALERDCTRGGGAGAAA